MATGTSFKQQCPSCEAMVPIRDPGLIGRKIDCPKCKYRFVVEEPAGDEDEDAAPKKKGGKEDPKGKADAKGKGGPRRRGEDGDKPAKKKQGGSSMLIIGGGLAVVAVVAIVVCAILFWPSEENKGSSPPPSGGSTAGAAPVSAPPTSAPTTTPEKPPPSLLVNVSNLLPNDTQAVLAYPFSATLGSALKSAAIDEADGGYKPERFRQMMGFGVEDINRLITAMNATTGWIFTILQTKKPYNPEVIAQQMRLSGVPLVKGKSGKTYDVFQTNADMDSLSNLLLKVNLVRGSLQVYFLDPNTIVFADEVPMKDFLENDAKPKFLSSEGPPPARRNTAPAGAGGAGAMGGPSAGMGGPMAGMGGPSVGGPSVGGPPMGAMPGNPMGPMGGGAPMGAMPGSPGAPGGTGTAAAPTPAISIPSSWLSVDPSLKLLLDRIEKFEDNKTTFRKEPASVVSVAALIAPLSGPILTSITQQLNDQEMPLVQRFLAQQAIANELKRFKTVGGSLAAFDQKEANVVLAVEYRDRREADTIDRTIRPMLAMAPPMIKTALGLNLQVQQPPTQQGSGGLGGPGFPGMMGAPGGLPPMGGIGPMGGFGPPRGSGGGGPPPMGGGGEGTLGAGPGLPGIGGGFGGTGPGGAQEEKHDGTLELSLEDKVHVFTADVQLTGEIYEKIFPYTREAMHLLKAQSDIASPRLRVHELGAALKAHLDDKGQFPPGAMTRPISTDRGLPWRPDQRLSWAVALLPYFGEDTREWKLDMESSWNEGKNVSVASRLVPALVAPQLKGLAPILQTYPGIPNIPLGSTHFVGMAGLGLDAMEYKSNDQSTMAKAGLFGYDRSYKKADVKDGLDKTIAFIMVPGDSRTPWLAGGGATLRGVDDTDPRPLAAFVCIEYPSKLGEPSKWDKKRGTIAVMADGRVRFIPEDLPSETFKALCTVSGGESIERLDTICPLIDPPAERELSTMKLSNLPRFGLSTPSAPAPVAPAPAPAPAPGAPANPMGAAPGNPMGGAAPPTGTNPPPMNPLAPNKNP